MIFSSRNYAIGLAHYQIAGGNRGLAIITAGYLAVAATIIGILLYNVPSGSVPSAMRGVSTLFLVIEAFALIMFGSVRVAGCIRLDASSNMIESHRQMPVSAPRAVLGYLLGTTSQVIAVAVLNVAVLSFTSRMGSLPFESIVVGQLVLASFALFVWSFVAMGAMMFRQAMPLIVLGFIFGSISSAFLRNFAILPGMTLLVTPFLGETIFNLSGGVVSFRTAYPIGLAAQAAFGSLFFIGACRRYRGTYMTTFSAPLGICLVSVWSLFSAVATRVWPEIIDRFGPRFDQPELSTQIVSAVAVAALLMLVPIHALATWETRHAVRPIMRWLALAGTTLAGTLAVVAGPLAGKAWLLTLLIMAAHSITFYAAFRFCRGMTGISTGVLVVGLLFAVWLIPILVEVIRWYFLPENRLEMVRHDMTAISTLSPLGLLLTVWNPAPDSSGPTIGIAFQWALAAVVWHMGVRRLNRTRKPGITPAPRLSASS